MNRRSKRIRTVLGAIIHEIRVERITFMAGSVAYNAFVSLLPLLILLLAIVSTVGNQQLESGLISVVRATATPGAADVLVAELRNASVEVSAFGLGVLVWGMLRIFRSLDAAFSDIYETETENTLTNQIVDGLTVFASMAAVVLVAVFVETRLTAEAATGVAWLGYRLLLVVCIALALFPMYYLFPDEPDMAPIEAVPGVAFTATALMCFESAFQLYLQYSSSTADNSVLAGILVFLTWLYLSGLVILIGAAINAVLSNRSDDVDIRPVIGGIPPSAAGDASSATASPAAAVPQLADQLSTASELTVTVDGDSTALPTPDSIDIGTGTATGAETDSVTSPDTATIRTQQTGEAGHVDISLAWHRDDDPVDDS